MLACILVRLILLSLLLSTCCPPVLANDWQLSAPHLWTQPFSRPTRTTSETTTRFAKLLPSETGIDFVNKLDWDHPQGLLFETGYACGGIAVGDLDGNGLPDLFFVCGAEPNRLYLQKSAWQFVETSIAAGVNATPDQPSENDGWGTGVAIFDLDDDGDLDIYVCNYDAANLLFINRGDGRFDERAADYGLDIVDACLMPAVADYDRDGDLDIFLAVNRYLEEKQFGRRDLFYRQNGMEYLRPEAKKYFAIRRHFDRAEQLNMWAGRKNYLLRNEGADKKFTDVSERIGSTRGDTLSATWWDYDHDGWPDLYVANDLAAPDRLLRNQQNPNVAEFEDVARSSLPHTPWQAMGSSAGDINNDGLMDFLVADMSFRTHFKDKSTMGDMATKFRNVGFFSHDQIMRNALYINTGTDHFQEAASLAGLASTDWTWAAKLADLDNDGRLDAFFTNGSPVNLADSADLDAQLADTDTLDTNLIRQRYRDLPPVLEQNLVYQNQGALSFVDRSEAWGLDHVGMSFAAVHADLDRDGDLDLVVANLDVPPSVYRNDSLNQGVLIQLRGQASNRFGIGAEVSLETAAGQQLRQVYPVSGFQSCQEATIHFGLGAETEIRRLTVRWPSGAEQLFENLQSNQQYLVEEPALNEQSVRSRTDTTAPLFVPLETIVAEHHEEPFDDFARQPLLPNKLSQLGPPMAWADVDADGDEDLFLGEGTDWMGTLYLNQGEMQFAPHPQVALARDAVAEDSAAAFFDANGDGALDLYVGSGSVECEAGDKRLRDRLYFGDAQGNFQHAPEGWLPDLRISTGAVAANDFDQDGDIDLVIGGRSIPGEYPLAPTHALLRNDGNRYIDVLASVAPELANAGMITAAVWADVNGDGWDDLLAAIDWGPVRLYMNRPQRDERRTLVEATASAGLAAWTGWWQSLACADLDNDGDLDFVAGNFGLNTKYKASPDSPVLIYYGEYDEPGQRNLIEAGYEGNVLFPLRGKSCSSSAMPHLAKRFPTYDLFAKATLSEIYTTDCLQQAERFEVNTLASACFLNDGQGNFKLIPLPTDAQLAPIFGIAVTEVNGDGIPDLCLAQNFFGPQKETGPMDGGVGIIALGLGDGNFESLRPDRTGVVVAGDAKAAAAVDIDGDGRQEICVATNNGPLKLFGYRGSNTVRSIIEPSASDSGWIKKNLSLAQQFIASDQTEQSLPYLRRALKVSPDDPDALLMLAIVRRDQERFGEATAILEQLRLQGVVNESKRLIETGRLFYRMKQYDRAEANLRQALAARPGNVRAALTFGDVLLKQGRLETAQHYFRQAGRPDRVAEAERQREIASVLYSQGRDRDLAGDEADAFRLYQRSMRIHSEHAPTVESLASLLRTAKDQRLRDLWLASKLEEQALRLRENGQHSP